MDKIGNKFIKEINSSPKRKIDIEIGDVHQEDFYPQLKIKHWDNECNFSVRLNEDIQGATVKDKNNIIEWKKGIKTARLYEKPEIGEDGGFEFEVEFSEKPSTNIVEYTLNTKDLDFFYQPELTQSQIDQGAQRPEDVVGSYAVYHKTKKHNIEGGKDYRSGKAFHIYRPFAIDNNGNRVWCHLNIENDLMTITIPQNFLDTAVYPVIVDPTFGYTSGGASNWGYNFLSPNGTGWAGLGIGIPFTEPSRIISISGYLSYRTGNTNPNFRFLVTLGGTTNEFIQILSGLGTINNANPPTLHTLNIPGGRILKSSTYVLGVAVQDQGFNLAYDTSSGQDLRFRDLPAGGTAVTDGTSPLIVGTSINWTDSADEDRIYTIYATYNKVSNQSNLSTLNAG